MKIAVNGFGRIGRTVSRILLNKGMNLVAVNDTHGVEDAAYLLKYDSIYRKYEKDVKNDGKHLLVEGKKILVLTERDPNKLPWKDLGVDVVIESTGAFRDKIGASAHLAAGAKYVIITAPAEMPDITIVPGVNDSKLKKSDKIISVASCTTNSLAPLTKVLEDEFGIFNSFMTTVHGYTSSQGLVDSFERKPARGRAAALNIVPTSTGATDAVVEVMPELKGKLSGMALRVPVPVGSITDLTAVLKKKVDAKKINEVFYKASKGKLKGILQYNEEPLVSSDLIGNSHSCIFNANDTQVNGNLIKVTAWYDNEFGYSCRVVDVVEMIRKWI